jgi:hypothetical protein
VPSCWRTTDAARTTEKAMIADFVELYGKRPIANRTG